MTEFLIMFGVLAVLSAVGVFSATWLAWKLGLIPETDEFFKTIWTNGKRNEIIMRDDVFNDPEKNYTVRIGTRRYARECTLINATTGEMRKVNTSCVHDIAIVLPTSYFNMLKEEFYPDLTDESRITTVFFFNLKDDTILK